MPSYLICKVINDWQNDVFKMRLGHNYRVTATLTQLSSQEPVALRGFGISVADGVDLGD